MYATVAKALLRVLKYSESLKVYHYQQVFLLLTFCRSIFNAYIIPHQQALTCDNKNWAVCTEIIKFRTINVGLYTVHSIQWSLHAYPATWYTISHVYVHTEVNVCMSFEVMICENCQPWETSTYRMTSCPCCTVLMPIDTIAARVRRSAVFWQLNTVKTGSATSQTDSQATTLQLMSSWTSSKAQLDHRRYY